MKEEIIIDENVKSLFLMNLSLEVTKTSPDVSEELSVNEDNNTNEISVEIKRIAR